MPPFGGSSSFGGDGVDASLFESLAAAPPLVPAVFAQPPGEATDGRDKKGPRLFGESAFGAPPGARGACAQDPRWQWKSWPVMSYVRACKAKLRLKAAAESEVVHETHRG